MAMHTGQSVHAPVLQVLAGCPDTISAAAVLRCVASAQSATMLCSKKEEEERKDQNCQGVRAA